MASNSPYPSPGSQDITGSTSPFYTGELDLAAKLSRAAAPLMVTTAPEDIQTAHHSLVTAPHVLTPSRPVGSPQQLAQDVMSLQTEAYDTSSLRRHGDILMPDSGHIKKRTKVSRACDECRRKKTRCNATPESTEPCAGCRRSNAQCLFSRQPLKRGPNKGYIRDLTERLATIERNLGAHASVLDPAPLAPLPQTSNVLTEYPASQILYDRMDRLEGRIEQLLSQLASQSKPAPILHQPEEPVSPMSALAATVESVAAVVNSEATSSVDAQVAALAEASSHEDPEMALSRLQA